MLLSDNTEKVMNLVDMVDDLNGNIKGSFRTIRS